MVQRKGLAGLKMMTEKRRLMIDGHVHIYDCYDLETFIETALKNLEHYYYAHYSNGSLFARILLLTEGKKNDFFSQFKKNGSFPNGRGYKFLETKEEVSITLVKGNEPLCYVLKGRQIVTRENLEVLALVSNQAIEDGLPAETVIERLIEKHEFAVLPWGFGKWFFKRGKIIRDLIEKYISPYLLIGDNSARPTFWPTPGLFKLAQAYHIPLINGSDPLPFSEEVRKVGTYGFSVEGDFNPYEPAESLREILIAPDTKIDLFGQRDRTIAFLKRQLKIHLVNVMK